MIVRKFLSNVSSRYTMHRLLVLAASMGLSGAVTIPSLGDPGEFYQQRRQELIAQFDLDGDGFLDAKEREQMRSTPKPEGKSFRRGGERRGQKRVRKDMPQHWLDKYDADGDGGLSDEEAGKGYWTERGLLFKAYDKNENKRLDEEETMRLEDDIAAGKFQSWDHFVANTTLNDERKKSGKRRPRLDARQRAWLKLDLNGDGRASKEEIAAIQKSEQP